MTSFCYNDTMSAKLLITGAGGYIGSCATSIFLDHGYDVVALDNFATGYRDPLKFLQHKYGDERLHIIQADLTHDLSPVFVQENDISAVIHFAAVCDLEESKQNPAKYYLNNVVGTHNLLSAMLKHHVKTIIFSSTCAVYGEAEYSPLEEDHPVAPGNPYAESKQMSEQMIRSYGQLLGLRYLIFRYFNVCGASDDGEIGDSKKPSTLLVQNAVRGALGIAPFYLTCPKVETPDGSPIRDFVNVVDLCEAHVKAIEYLRSHKTAGATINLGAGEGSSVLDLIRAVRDITGTQFRIQKSKSRSGESPRVIASINQAKRLLGWQPKHTLKDSINSLATWYTKHPHGWDS